MRRRSLQVLAGLAAIAALSLVAIAWPRGSERHGDGAGPLGSYGAPGFESMRIDPVASDATSWTYGVRLCLASGDTPAILESVLPTKTVGSGFRFLGVGVRAFTPSPEHAPIISTHPWPPPPSVVPDPIGDLGGFAVSTPCSGGPDGPYTELLVGLGYTSADGGGWQGLDVSYSVGGRHHVLTLDHDLMICGLSVDCRGPS